ncbi:MAG: ATP-grasp fold amidoligase family protein [Bacteroidales bacterium]|nr:ATP-grasp fold amidoligase family protein [Bacteroidales bacterium]
MDLRSTPNIWFRYLLTSISPKWTINMLFRMCHHRKPDLDHPQTLDEKIQWMKLHYYKDNALVKQCADKWTVRDYVKDCGLESILTEVITCYDDPEEINWEKLPEKFVLKWNFGNGGNVVCTDKRHLNIKQATRDLKRFQKIKFHLLASEPQYDVAKKVLICEKFIEPEHGSSPVDYKFYCFSGEAKYVLCCIGRQEGQKPAFYFFDRDWKLQRLNRQGIEAPESFTIPKPEGMDALFEYAEKLSKPFPFVRADFYLERGKAYFGELTFTPSGGFDYGRLPESDLLFGNMVKLDTERLP